MPIKHRSPHPSHIGRLDLNVRGTSDPGSSGLLTPFIETDGLYFEAGMEKEDGIFDMEKELLHYNTRLEDVRASILSYMSDDDTPEQVLDRNQKIMDINDSIVMKVELDPKESEEE